MTELVPVTVKFTGGELERIDERWKKREFSNRSDYIRFIVRSDLEVPLCPPQ